MRWLIRRTLKIATTLEPDEALDALERALAPRVADPLAWRARDDDAPDFDRAVALATRTHWAVEREGSALAFAPQVAWSMQARAIRPHARASAAPAPFGSRVTLEIRPIGLGGALLLALLVSVGLATLASVVAHGEPEGALFSLVWLVLAGWMLSGVRRGVRAIERASLDALPSVPPAAGPFR